MSERRLRVTTDSGAVIEVTVAEGPQKFSIEYEERAASPESEAGTPAPAVIPPRPTDDTIVRSQVEQLPLRNPTTFHKVGSEA